MITFDEWKIEPRCRWYNPGKSIRLYHGTSSSLILKIKSQGLVSPVGSIDERIEAAIRLFGVEPDAQLMKRMQRIASSFWSWNHVNCICFTTNPYNASQYAHHNHMYGGEMNKLVAYYLGRLLRRKFGPLYLDSIPTVVDVLVPVSWVPNIQKYRDDAVQLLQYYALKEFDKEQIKHEIRIGRRIAASRIRRIMQAPKLFNPRLGF